MKMRRNEGGDVLLWTDVLTTPTLTTKDKNPQRHGAVSRRHVATFVLLSVLGLGICLVCYTTYFPRGIVWIAPNLTPVANYLRSRSYSESKLIGKNETKGCNFPRLDPYEPQIKEFIKEPPLIDCFAHYPPRFRTNFGNQLVPVHAGDSISSNETCCYKTISREKKSDSNIRYSKMCHPVSLTNITIIPTDHEFISIRCSRPYVTPNCTTNCTRSSLNLTTTHNDMFAFVHPKPEVEARVRRYEMKQRGHGLKRKDERLSVLILGLDAQSHMNFQRQMKRSHAFLLHNLSGIGLQGYTKVGDNTFPNIIPLLTGLTVEELKTVCWPSKSSYFDNCPFIWKQFAEAGYRTSFGEDAIWMGTFNYEKKGFLRPPTDYYLHPLTLLMSKKIGHETLGNAKLCYGPRLAFEVLLDYLVKTAVTFRDKAYFQYIWANSLFHDYLNNPKLGDDLLALTFEYLSRNGHLDNTMLLVVSDHGMRWGGIRATYQGKIEERMPTCYFVFPPWFRAKYSNEIEALIENARERLTTPFDVHATLEHILELGSGSNVKSSVDVGLSLLRPIGRGRRCTDAGVKDHWCVCNRMKKVDHNASSIVAGAASFVVQSINEALKPWGNDCAKLRLDRVMEAMQTIVEPEDDIRSKLKTEKNVRKGAKSKGKKMPLQLQLTLLTSPGQALFEATVDAVDGDDGGWKVSGEISRLNIYREQSLCVTDAIAQKYCYCADLGVTPTPPI